MNLRNAWLATSLVGCSVAASLGCGTDGLNLGDNDGGSGGGSTHGVGGNAGSAGGGISGGSGGNSSNTASGGGPGTAGSGGAQPDGGPSSKLECESGPVTLLEWTSSVSIDDTLRAGVNDTRLVVDSGFAYFDFGGPLRRISIRDHAERVITPTSEHAFDARAGIVYFANGGMLYRATMDGAPVAVAPSKQYFGSNVSANATHVYWVDDTHVMRSPLAGGFSAQATGLISNGDVVTSAGHVFTMPHTILPGDMGGSYEVFTVTAQPTAGGSAVQLGPFRGAKWLVVLAADDAGAYMESGSRIERFALADGAEVSPALTAPGTVTSFALDADNLYAGIALDACSSVSDPASASCQAALQRFPRSGASSVRYRDLDQLPIAMAVDDRCVYWLQAKRVAGNSWSYAAKLAAAPKN